MNKDGKIISILGKRGRGKTFLAHLLFLSAKNISFYFSFKKPLFF
jgi:DNA replication protein DnaC